MTDDHQIWLRYVGGVAVASLARDEAGKPFAFDALYRLLDLERGRVVIAFPADGLVSSAVLGKLMTLHRKAQAAGWAIRLFCPAGSVRDVLRLTKLDRIFGVYDTLDAAIRDY
jgi:anti-sigma B factor antagonist